MPASDGFPYTIQQFRGGYALVWRDQGKRRRRQLESEDRASAEAEARALWQNGDDTPWTMERIMSGYLASIAGKPSHSRRIDAWKALKPFWQNVDLKLIDERMCRNYRASRSAGDATARYELMQISTALGWAVKNGPRLAGRPPVWLPLAPERKTRHLDQQEFAKFFAAVRADHARLYVMLGLHIMARPSAILELTWDRVDFMRRLIDFTPPGHVRTAKRRTIIPISDALLPHLQRGFEARTCQFVIEHGGDRILCIKKAFQAANVRSTVYATPYTLRHTGAVWAAEGGVSMPELAQFMGHDDDRTTQKHYARFSPDHLASVGDAIAKAVRGSI